MFPANLGIERLRAEMAVVLTGGRLHHTSLWQVCRQVGLRGEASRGQAEGEMRCCACRFKAQACVGPHLHPSRTGIDVSPAGYRLTWGIPLHQGQRWSSCCSPACSSFDRRVPEILQIYAERVRNDGLRQTKEPLHRHVCENSNHAFAQM